jgi:hypothetical protein
MRETIIKNSASNELMVKESICVYGGGEGSGEGIYEKVFMRITKKKTG